MKTMLTLGFLALTGLSLSSANSLAGANSSQDSATQDKSAKVRTVTGCLSKGESDKEYTLTTDAGATWEVKSDAVKFGSHLGHTVRLTGTVENATMHGEKEKAKEKMTDNPTEHGHMVVTNLKMVSESCGK